MLGELTSTQIEHVLRRELIGRIGCCVGDEMYVVPVSYVYHNGHVYAHSKEGRKIRMMRKNPKVCFQVDSTENLANWRSVILWGQYEELKSEKEQRAGMKMLVERFMPFITGEAARPSQASSRPPKIVEKEKKPIVYRIRITMSTGRFEKISC